MKKLGAAQLAPVEPARAVGHVLHSTATPTGVEGVISRPNFRPYNAPRVKGRGRKRRQSYSTSTIVHAWPCFSAQRLGRFPGPPANVRHGDEHKLHFPGGNGVQQGDELSFVELTAVGAGEAGEVLDEHGCVGAAQAREALRRDSLLQSRVLSASAFRDRRIEGPQQVVRGCGSKDDPQADGDHQPSTQAHLPFAGRGEARLRRNRRARYVLRLRCHVLLISGRARSAPLFHDGD